MSENKLNKFADVAIVTIDYGQFGKYGLINDGQIYSDTLNLTSVDKKVPIYESGFISNKNYMEIKEILSGYDVNWTLSELEENLKETVVRSEDYFYFFIR